jgi:hypothetical protein
MKPVTFISLQFAINRALEGKPRDAGYHWYLGFAAGEAMAHTEQIPGMILGYLKIDWDQFNKAWSRVGGPKEDHPELKAIWERAMEMDTYREAREAMDRAADAAYDEMLIEKGKA